MPPHSISRRFTPKVLSFIVEYVVCRNATQAAIRAGYSARSASTTAYRLLRNEQIAAEIERRELRRLERLDLKAEDILEEIRRIALFDPRGVFDESGNLRPVSEWTVEQAACLSSFEIIKKNAEAGDGKTDTIHKVRFWSKDKALELAAKHFALLTEKVVHTGGIEIRWMTSERPDREVLEGEVMKQLSESVEGERDKLTEHPLSDTKE